MRNTSLPQELFDAVRSGHELAGDSLRGDALVRWYEQEKEAFFEGGADSGPSDPWYAYMRFVNDRLVFRELERRDQGDILFLGAAEGTEAVDFHRRRPAWRLHFLEASDNFRARLTAQFPGAAIIEPDPAGRMPIADASLDAVCAFCVLHHIANVSEVLGEVARVLKRGGQFFVREPCSSMGDWRGPRSATPNERGISRHWMIRTAAEVGLSPHDRPIPVVFEPINKTLVRTIGYRLVPRQILYVVDRLLSALVALNDHYWRDTTLKKIGPSSYHYRFRK